MIEHGKVMAHLRATGRSLAKLPPPHPEAWDPASDGRAWDDAVAHAGFSPADGENPRWILSNVPGPGVVGVTIIVLFEHGTWSLDFSVDTESTENESVWEVGVPAPSDITTPLEAARWARQHVKHMLLQAVSYL